MTKPTKKIKMNKLWINNHYAQAMILMSIGFSFLFSAKTIQLGYLLVLPFGVMIGILVRGCEPK